MMVLTKAVRFSSEATLVEKYWEPAHPPTETMALTFCMDTVSCCLHKTD